MHLKPTISITISLFLCFIIFHDLAEAKFGGAGPLENVAYKENTFDMDSIDFYSDWKQALRNKVRKLKTAKLFKTSKSGDTSGWFYGSHTN